MHVRILRRGGRRETRRYEARQGVDALTVTVTVTVMVMHALMRRGGGGGAVALALAVALTLLLDGIVSCYLV